MTELDELKKLIDQNRQEGKKNLKSDLKKAIVKAAEVHGSKALLKSTGIHPSTFYKWQKKYSNSGAKTEFVEIEHSQFSVKPTKSQEIIGAAKHTTQIRWEAVRSDGSVLRCELNGNGSEIGAVFNNFLNGGKLL